MISAAEAVILGIIQGITEWLPISSSAHLALVQYFFGIRADVAFDIILHLGTLFAVIVYYRNDLMALARGVVGRKEAETRYAMLVLLAAIPTAIIGFAFKDFFESMFTNPVAVAGALALTGYFLITIGGLKQDETKRIDRNTAFAVGIAQGIAVAPGISRSGATIGTALMFGIEKEEAAKFSFLAAIIPILGASIIEAQDTVLGSADLAPLIIGFVVSAIVGYVAIAVLIKFLKESKLSLFGYYCLTLAAIVLILVRFS